MNTNGKMQIFYGVDNPASIKKPNQAGNVPTKTTDATGVALSTQPTAPQTSPQPITELVGSMKKVKTDTPEAKLNKDSMVDNHGNRITFNDEETRSQTFKGVDDPSSFLLRRSDANYELWQHRLKYQQIGQTHKTQELKPKQEKRSPSTTLSVMVYFKEL